VLRSGVEIVVDAMKEVVEVGWALPGCFVGGSATAISAVSSIDDTNTSRFAAEAVSTILATILL
jgi:hypothetical protein